MGHIFAYICALYHIYFFYDVNSISNTYLGRGEGGGGRGGCSMREAIRIEGRRDKEGTGRRKKS